MARRVSFIERGSFRKIIENGKRSSSTLKRGLIGMQMDEDTFEKFNSSMGCPLASFEEATLSLVGGKALQCWRMMKHGLPVPSAFVIPTYVYSLHVEAAGIEDIIDEIFSSDLRDGAIREAVRPKLAQVRERILGTPMAETVVHNIVAYLDTFAAAPPSFAVRSSGSAEDLASQSFAGQYDTFLYKTDVDDIVESIKMCWASMFNDHVLEYIGRSVSLQLTSDGGSNTNIKMYSPENMKAPQMGVLIMEMVDATATGVCFTRNLWGEHDEVMIEAVPGQGEGLVGGEITPDRFVVNKFTGKLVYQDIHTQTHKFCKAKTDKESSGGLEKTQLEKTQLEDPLDTPILSSRHLKAINVLARTIEDFYNVPQDIEWAIDGNGKLRVLQTRPITTLEDQSSLSFLPPGEGLWKFDPVHFPRPLSPWMQAAYSFGYIEHNARRTGSMIRTIKLRFVHQFSFSQPEIVPPSDALERAAQAYWEKKLYEDDYREFTDFFRPETEALQDELRQVNPSALGHDSIVTYVGCCFDLAREFWKRHHTYTFPAMVVVGDFMNRMAELTGKHIMETLQLLEASSPESRGLLNRRDPLLDRMYNLLCDSKQAMKLLQHKDATWALDCLMHMPGELGRVMREVRSKYGWRLAGGYDLVVPAMIESPDFFLKTLYMGTQEDPDLADKAEEKVWKLADEWKALLPADKHDEFEEILDVGQRFFRLRDERGLATDLSGIGLCRRGILEAGRRLEQQGIILRAHHLCVATKEEALALLSGEMAKLTLGGASLGPVHIPTPRESERRFDYITSADPNLVPEPLEPHHRSLI